MQTKLYWQVALLLAVALCSRSALAAAEKVSPNDLPKKVMDCLGARFKTMEIVSAEKEIEGGKVVYDIELKQEGRKVETDIQDDGTMLEIEKEIVEEKWPKELMAGLKAAHPDPKVIEVMKVCKVHGKQEVPDHFEVTIETADAKHSELLFTLDGKPMKEEASSSSAEAPSEEDVAIDKLPTAVKAAIKAKFPKAKMHSAEQGKEDGKPIYEVSLKQNKQNIDVTLVPDGTILSFEKTIAASEMPKAMSETLESKYPQAKIKVVEETWEHDQLTGFEATIVTKDKKTVEVMFDPKGKIVSNKAEG
jgi:uncharacterized membrane protein YkoI